MFCIAFASELYTMASGDTVVTTEPKSRRKEIDEFVRDLDPLQVAG